MKLYRTMKIDPTDGKPLVGKRRNMLGVRPTDPTNTNPRRKFDVDAAIGSDPVTPGARQGLSVSTASGGLFPDEDEAIWEIDDSELLPDFNAVPDHPPHHVLEPTGVMTLNEYQAALVATRDTWVRVL
ncbi:MAG TPA: hypothetical protein VFG68_10300 [Fimbriiglobus sp.]|nr:hypothetical protein [Fimbriiglobus sp.]